MNKQCEACGRTDRPVNKVKYEDDQGIGSMMVCDLCEEMGDDPLENKLRGEWEHAAGESNECRTFNEWLQAQAADPASGCQTDALALLTEQGNPPIEIVCAKCGSADVRRNADTAWSVIDQEWEIVALFDSCSCEKCGRECNVVARPIKAAVPA